MAGTKQGGKLAALTNKAKYGDDFYRNIGREGGKNGRTGGFYVNRELARTAGAKGGKISRRRPAVKVVEAPVVENNNLLQRFSEVFRSKA